MILGFENATTNAAAMNLRFRKQRRKYRKGIAVGEWLVLAGALMLLLFI